MLATPIVYTASSVLDGRPDWLATLYALNPMAGIAEAFRFAVVGGASAPWHMLAYSAGSTVILLVSGLAAFRRLECLFADRV
jgi:lipopolysaccharide transport system permease protein